MRASSSRRQVREGQPDDVPFALALIALALPAAVALAGDAELITARDRYLAAANAAYPDTPDGVQARYDAGRDLIDAVVAAGEACKGLRPLRADLLAMVARRCVVPRRSTGRAARRALLRSLRPPGSKCRLGRGADPTPARRLAQAAAQFDGVAAVCWMHELATGRYAGVEADTRFAAASTVKLGALARALRRTCARPKPLVVRRPPDRLLVLEPGREPDRA